MNLRIYRVIIPVSDIEAAKDFYQKLFGMPGKRVSPGRHYFNLGNVIFACYDPKVDGDNDIEFSPNPDHVYISVDKLDELFLTASKLNFRSIDEKIETQPWGERCFYTQDPFGNPLCFVDSATVFMG